MQVLNLQLQKQSSWKVEMSVTNYFLSVLVGLSWSLHIMKLEKWLYEPRKKDPWTQDAAGLFWEKFEDIKITAT